MNLYAIGNLIKHILAHPFRFFLVVLIWMAFGVYLYRRIKFYIYYFSKNEERQNRQKQLMQYKDFYAVNINGNFLSEVKKEDIESKPKSDIKFNVDRYNRLYYQKGRFTKVIPNYIRKKSLLTDNELVFIKVLYTITNKYNLYVAPQVILYEIIQVNAKAYTSKYQRLLNKIHRKSIDYVLCNNSTFDIVACVELDDETHYRRKRKERDKFLDEIFNEVGIPLIHIKRQDKYSLEEVEKSIISRIKI